MSWWKLLILLAVAAGPLLFLYAALILTRSANRLADRLLSQAREASATPDSPASRASESGPGRSPEDFRRAARPYDHWADELLATLYPRRTP